MLDKSYQTAIEIARDTGGRAFFSNNDVAELLTEATAAGEAFYTLTYAPGNHVYNGHLRHIVVELAKKGYTLEYRRSYFATPSPQEFQEPGSTVPVKHAKAANVIEVRHRPVGDSLSANMQLGASMAHQLLFGLEVHLAGKPEQATQTQMASLATEPAYFRLRKRIAAGKPVAPVQLQHYTLSYRIFARQFNTQTAALNLEVAAAAYDADSQLLNGLVMEGTRSAPGSAPPASEAAKFFRVDETFEVPSSATVLRFAVRDTSTDRIGAMEVKLPLSQEDKREVEATTLGSATTGWCAQ